MDVVNDSSSWKKQRTAKSREVQTDSTNVGRVGTEKITLLIVGRGLEGNSRSSVSLSFGRKTGSTYLLARSYTNQYAHIFLQNPAPGLDPDRDTDPDPALDL